MPTGSNHLSFWPRRPRRSFAAQEARCQTDGRHARKGTESAIFFFDPDAKSLKFMKIIIINIFQ